MQEIDILKIVLNYMIPLCLGGVIGIMTNQLKESKKKHSSLEKGVQALLRNELVRCYREYKIKGEISILDKENFEDMLEEYENLGGNGTMKKFGEEIINSPTLIVKN